MSKGPDEMTDATKLIERLRKFLDVAAGEGHLCGGIDAADLHDEIDLIEQQAARIAEFERILDGLPQDAIDGGWTARGISAYAKHLEGRVAELHDAMARDAERYRWLRRRAVMMDYSDEAVTTITLFKDEGPTGEFLDDQIDGEIAKEKR